MQCNLRKFSTLVYHQFLSSIKKDEHKKENWFFFLPHGVYGVVKPGTFAFKNQLN